MVRILQVNILRSMVNVFTIQRKVCVKGIPNLVEVQNEIKSKCFNIVSVVIDNVDDNGENSKKGRSISKRLPFVFEESVPIQHHFSAISFEIYPVQSRLLVYDANERNRRAQIFSSNPNPFLKSI